MRVFSLFLVLCTLAAELTAQYSIADEKLVYTTYTREFDKGIIKDYLNSNDEFKINAALLSISHSEDTSFIPSIINLKIGGIRYISFALGQLPPSRVSSNYLIDRLNSADDSDKPGIMGELGKVIQNDQFDSLLVSLEEKPVPGFSRLLASYHQRGMEYDKDLASELILGELKENGAELFYALYSAYRTGLCGMVKEEVDQLLNNKLYSSNSGGLSTRDNDVLFYALACLRRADFFNGDDALFNKILELPYYPVKVEAVKYAVKKRPLTEENINKLFSIVYGENINLAVQTLISLREVKSSGYNFSNELLEIIQDNEMDIKIKGEAAVSLYNLFPEVYDSNRNYLQSVIPSGYMFEIFVLMPEGDVNIDELVSRYNSSDNSLKIKILELLFNGKHSLLKFEKFIMSVLNGSFAPGISLAAGGLDSLFISNNSELLKADLIRIVNRYLHDPAYIESLISLSGLAGRIGDGVRDTVFNLLSESELYSLRKYASGTIPVQRNMVKEDNNFKNVWNNSFKFRTAVIATDKSVLEIELLPEYAPVSAGNFSYWVQLNFYKGIRFHRVVPGFVIQAGDPTNTGWGGSEFEIVSEFSPLDFDTGYLGMASAGKDTESSQWFIMQGHHPHLNGRYSIFGKIKTGIEEVFNTGINDKILSIELKN